MVSLELKRQTLELNCQWSPEILDPRDISNALDMLLHMLQVVADGKALAPADIAEMKRIISRIEASK